jgi:hypothetical protein
MRSTSETVMERINREGLTQAAKQPMQLADTALKAAALSKG